MKLSRARVVIRGCLPGILEFTGIRRGECRPRCREIYWNARIRGCRSIFDGETIGAGKVVADGAPLLSAGDRRVRWGGLLGGL